MANVEKFIEIGAVVLEVFQTIQEMFQNNGSNDILSVGDSLMFLTTKSLGFSSNGNLSGSFAKAGQAILQLSELFLTGIILFFALRCLFSYLMYKKQEIPWRFFLRMVVVGILAAGAYYLCFGAVFLTENMTEYIRDYLGNEVISFEVINENVDKLKFKTTEEDEVINLFDADNMINILAHFSAILASVFMGMRYVLLEILILFSPIFLLFAGFEETKVFAVWWSKLFFGMLICQLFVAILLGIFSFQTFGSGKEKSILLVSCLFLIIKLTQISLRRML